MNTIIERVVSCEKDRREKKKIIRRFRGLHRKKIDTDLHRKTLIKRKTKTVIISFDLGSGETNSTVTPNNIGTINGHRLKFDPSQADEGIFFIAIPTGTELKVTAVQRNKPGQLVFMVPDMPAGGTLNLEVRARSTDGGDLRIGRLDTILNV